MTRHDPHLLRIMETPGRLNPIQLCFFVGGPIQADLQSSAPVAIDGDAPCSREARGAQFVS